jgi:2-octaprenyl-6-methoxyphenol hydroxylase
MDTTHDIAIIGAGPVGGALACRLAAGGLKILLADRAALPPMEHPDFDGRAYAIAAGSQRLLAEAGLWEALPFTPCPILDILVTDGRPGQPPSPLKLHFGHESVGSEPFGWIIEARALRIAINRRLHASPGITLHAPAEAAVTRHTDHAEITSSRRMAAPARCARPPASRSPASPTSKPPSSAPSRMKSRMAAWRWNIFCPAAPSPSCQ